MDALGFFFRALGQEVLCLWGREGQDKVRTRVFLFIGKTFKRNYRSGTEKERRIEIAKKKESTSNFHNNGRHMLL